MSGREAVAGRAAMLAVREANEDKTAAAAEVAMLRKQCYNAIPVAADELPS